MCVRQSYSCVMSQKRLERISSNLKQHPFELKKELIRLCWLEVKVTVTSWCLILLNTISQKCNERIPSMLKRLLGLTFLQLIFFFFNFDKNFNTNQENYEVITFYVQKVKGQLHCDIIKFCKKHSVP